MQIAVASGKGGTGKTTVATNLATVACQPIRWGISMSHRWEGRSVAYLDCDVEEPNGHIFLRPELTESRPVGNLLPAVDEQQCTRCGQCGEICQYSAIVSIGEKVLVYPELCHACGGCQLVCPVDAVRETLREIGRVEIGRAGPIRFVHGVLNVGEPMSPPLINAVKAAALEADLVIADAPPGTSCPVIESLRGADFVILVTEPTPFGFHDLKLAVELTRAMKLPCGVVINRATLDGQDVHSYCKARRIPILAEIADDRRLAEAYCRGEMACEALAEYRAKFVELLKTVTDSITRGRN